MLEIGTNCEPLDLPKSIDAVALAYKAGGLEAPKFHFVAGSPISGSIMGVCLQRYFRGLENDPREPKILDQPFLVEAAKCVDELTRELTTYAQTTAGPGEIGDALLAQVPSIQTLQEYIDKNHIEHCNNGGTLPLKLPDVAVDAAAQFAIELVDAITETTNDGELREKLPAKTPTALPEKLAPLGRTNLARFQSLVATTVALILANLAQAKNGKALATRFTNEPGGLFQLVHRRLRRSLHSWLTEKIEEIKKRDIPKEIDEEFARGCQQQFSDQANGNHDTSWSCYYDFLLNVCGVKEVEPLQALGGNGRFALHPKSLAPCPALPCPATALRKLGLPGPTTPTTGPTTCVYGLASRRLPQSQAKCCNCVR